MHCSSNVFKPGAKGIVEQMSVALRGLHLRMAEELADHRKRHPARNEQRREGMAQIVDADAGRGLFPPIFSEPLDNLKRLAFGLAGNTHSQSSGTRSRIVQQRGGGSADRRAMQTALLRGGGRFDPDRSN